MNMGVPIHEGNSRSWRWHLRVTLHTKYSLQPAQVFLHLWESMRPYTTQTSKRSAEGLALIIDARPLETSPWCISNFPRAEKCAFWSAYNKCLPTRYTAQFKTAFYPIFFIWHTSSVAHIIRFYLPWSN